MSIANLLRKGLKNTRDQFCKGRCQLMIFCPEEKMAKHKKKSMAKHQRKKRKKKEMKNEQISHVK